MSKAQQLIDLRIYYNPLDLKDVQAEHLAWREDATLGDYLEGLPEDVTWLVFVNGNEVDRHAEASRSLRPGDRLSLFVVPEGGDGFKSVMRLVVMAAAATIAAISGQWYVVAAVTLGAGLINTFLLTPKQRVADNGDGDQSYGIDGAKNSATENIPVPIVYGRYRQAGNFSDVFTENVGDDQYLYLRSILADGRVKSISQVEVNEQPVENFSNVEVRTSLGELDPPVNDWFNRTVRQVNKNVKLNPGQWVEHVTTDQIDQARFDVVFPQGLVDIKKKDGSHRSRTVTFRVEHRLIGSSTYQPLDVPVAQEEVLDDKPATHTTPGGVSGIAAHVSIARTDLAQMADNDTIAFEYAPSGTNDWQVGGEVTKTEIAAQQGVESFAGVDLGFGNIDYINTSFDIPTLPTGAYDIRVSAGGINSVTSFSSGGTFSVSAARTTAVRRSFYTAKLPKGTYEVRIIRDTPDAGSQYIIDEVWLSDVAEIENDAIKLSGLTTVSLRIKLTDQLNGIPSMTALVEGSVVKQYDDAGNVVAEDFSANPAWIFADMHCGEARGAGFPVSRMDWPAIVDWAEENDAKGIEFNGVFSEESTLHDAIETICRVGHAAPIDVGTKRSITIDRPRDPVQVFTSANMIENTFSIGYMPVTDRANEFEAVYYDKNDRNKAKTIRYVDPKAVQFNEVARAAQLDLRGIDNQAAAAKELWRQIYANRLLMRTGSFDAYVDSISCTIGDVILIQTNRMEWSQGGLLRTGSTASELVLDQVVPFENGKNYSVIVQHDALKVSEAQVQGKVGQVLTIATSDDLMTIKPTRLIVGSQDFEIITIKEVGLAYSVLVNGADLSAVNIGTQAELWKTDVIEERAVTAVDSGDDYNSTITVSLPFSQAPTQHSRFIFGETQKVMQKYTVLGIDGEGIERRTLSFIEYDERVYAPGETDIEVPIEPLNDRQVNQVRSLRISYDKVAKVNQQTVDCLVEWNAGHIQNFAGADVWARINGAEWRSLGTSLNVSQYSFKAAVGDVYEVRVVAFNRRGDRAPVNQAPSVKATIEIEADADDSVPIRYPDGVPIEDLKPAEPGATEGAPPGTPVGGMESSLLVQKVVQVDTDLADAKTDIADLFTAYGSTSSAAASAQQALAAAQASEAAKLVSEGARDIAQQAQANAELAQSQAEAARGQAQAAQGAAELARNAAQTEAGNALAQAQAAAGSAGTAAGHATTASTKADEATGSASAAAASALVANSKAGEAAGSAQAANVSAQSAATSATDAGNFASAANNSRISAETSLTAAKRAAGTMMPSSFEFGNDYWVVSESSAGPGDYNVFNGNHYFFVDIQPEGYTLLRNRYPLQTQPGNRLRIKVRVGNWSPSAPNPRSYIRFTYYTGNGIPLPDLSNRVIFHDAPSIPLPVVEATYEHIAEVDVPAGVTNVYAESYVSPGSFTGGYSTFHQTLWWGIEFEDITATHQATQAAAQASISRDEAVGAASTAAGHASTAANQVTLATQARNDAQGAASAANTARNEASSFAGQAGTSATTSATQALIATAAKDAAVQAAARQFVGDFTDELEFWQWLEHGPVTQDFYTGGFGLAGNTLSANVHPHPYVVLSTKYPLNSNGTGRRWRFTTTQGVWVPDPQNQSNSYAYLRMVTQSGAVWNGSYVYWNGVNNEIFPTLEFVTTNPEPFRIDLVVHRNGGSQNLNFHVYSITGADITEQYNAQQAANAASTSAANASASETAAGQQASAAQTARNEASTFAGNASTSAGQAATSASNAAGSASTASSQAQLAAEARNAANTAYFRSFPNSFATELDRSSYVFSQPPSEYIGPGQNWPTPFLANWAGGFNDYMEFRHHQSIPNPGTPRRIRISTWVFSYDPNVGFGFGMHDSSVADFSSDVTFQGHPQNSPGEVAFSQPNAPYFQKISGDFVTSPSWKAYLRPYVYAYRGNGIQSGGIHIGPILQEDVTSEYESQQSAAASLTSAQSASASQDAAGASAQAAQTARLGAEAANGTAQSAASAASSSASLADQHQASAATSASLSAQYRDQALDHRNAAANSATAASSSATVADGHRSAAATSANLASNFATNAIRGASAQGIPSLLSNNDYWFFTEGWSDDVSYPEYQGQRYVLTKMPANSYSLMRNRYPMAVRPGMVVRATERVGNWNADTPNAIHVSRFAWFVDGVRQLDYGTNGFVNIPNQYVTVDHVNEFTVPANCSELYLETYFEGRAGFVDRREFLWWTVRLEDVSSEKASQSFANNASNSATQADGHRASAANSATLSAGYRDEALGHRNSAQSFASQASGSAAAASASESTTLSYVTQASSFGVQALNKNPFFATPGWTSWVPPQWDLWNHENSSFIGPYGANNDRPNPYAPQALQMDRNSGSTGIVFPFYSIKMAAGWYVIEADVWVQDGSWAGAGLHWNFDNGYFGSLDFGTDPDINEWVFGGGSFQNRKFSKLWYNGAQTGNDPRFYAMAGWPAFASWPNATGFARTIWHKALIRPATMQEIEARKALNNAASNAAQISSVNTTLTTAISALAGRTSTVEARFDGLPGDNRLPSSEWPNGNTTGWESGATHAGYNFGVNGAGDYWAPRGEKVLSIHQTNRIGAESYGHWRSNHFSVTPGEWLQHYVFFASHRAPCEIYVEFYNVNGDFNGNYGGFSGRIYNGDNGGPGPDAYPRLGVKSYQVPPGAATARLVMRKYDTNEGGGDSWAWFWRPYVGPARPGQADWNPYIASNGRALVGAVDARVTTTEGAIADINGAAAFYETVVAASGSNPAIVSLKAGRNGSAINFTGDRIVMRNVVNGEIVEVAKFENGVAQLNSAMIRRLRVAPRSNSSIFLPVMLRPIIRLGSDGQWVQYQNGASFGANPERISADLNGLPALGAGESYDIRAINISDTGFTAYAKKITAAEPVTQNTGAGVNVGGTPQWVVNKPTALDAFNGNYQYTFQVSGQLLSSEPLPGGGGTQNEWRAAGDIYATDSAGNWQVVGSYNHFWGGPNAGGTNTLTVTITSSLSIGQNGGYEFGVHPVIGGVTSFAGVIYSTQVQANVTPVSGAISWVISPPVPD